MTTKKSGIPSARSYRIEKKCIEFISETYSLARILKWDHKRISARNAEMYVREDYNKLPAHSKRYIQGYESASRKLYAQYNTEWRMSLDGALVSREEIRVIAEKEKAASTSDGYQSPWARVDNDKSSFTYINCPDKPY